MNITPLDFLCIDPAKLSGVWWDLVTRRPCAGNAPHESNPCVRIVPHGAAFDAFQARAYQPFLAQRLRGEALDAATERRIQAECLAAEVVVDWANVFVGTPPAAVPYSKAAAAELLADPKWTFLVRIVTNAFRDESSLLLDAERTIAGN